MLILVTGCGSIGKRHIRNLLSLKAGTVIAHDPLPERRTEIERDYAVKTFNTLEEALIQQPDVTAICTPTSLHMRAALLAAKSGSHLFIEKPISQSLEGVDELIGIISQKKLVSLVGCNMRFHPGISKIKQLLDVNSIGKVISIRVQCGSYLPEWHPWEDYRQSYSARQSLGGGVLLDNIHEIDYVRWFLGKASEVFCFSGKLSSLEIDTEDVAEILLKFNSGIIAEIHLDYIQRIYERSCQIIGEEGTIFWDFNEKNVKLYNANNKSWEIFSQKPDYDTNEMYIEEMKHLLKCVAGKEESIQDAKSAKEVLEIVLLAKESTRTRSIINL